MNSILGKSILFAMLAGGTAWICLATGLPPADSGAGLVMRLPDRVGDWTGVPAEPSEAEKQILPPDTEFAKMNYHHADSGAPIQAGIVLSGKDRTSIHRPEVCLAGQGWNIDRSEVRTVTLKNGHDLGIKCLSVSREITLRNGESKKARGFYLYWFIGSRTTTPDNLERILNTATDNLLHGINPRWAYTNLMALVTEDLAPDGLSAAETLAQLDAWIAEAAPEFQRVFEPAGLFR